MQVPLRRDAPRRTLNLIQHTMSVLGAEQQVQHGIESKRAVQDISEYEAKCFASIGRASDSAARAEIESW